MILMINVNKYEENMEEKARVLPTSRTASTRFKVSTLMKARRWRALRLVLAGFGLLLLAETGQWQARTR
jgi:hypothetical protein